MRSLNLETYKGGVLYPLDNPNDYVFGAVSGIVHEARNTTGQWLNFTPTDESQSFRFFDDFGCATHSALNSIEIQFQFLIFSNLLNADDLQWLKDHNYFDPTGRLNVDDRWIVLLSNTKPGVGNYLSAVWDAIRKFGLIPQGVLPFSQDWSLERYYNKTDFSQEAYNFGKEFLNRFLIQYEKVSADLNTIKQALTHAPVQIGAATCPGWNGDQIIPVCSQNANHANVIIGIDPSGILYDYDSYSPFQKRLAKGYQIAFAYKGVLTPKNSVDGKKKPNFLFKKNLQFGDANNDVSELAKRLIQEDCLFNYTPTQNDVYGPEIARGVLAYQQKYHLINWFQEMWYRGRYFYEKTRFHMNAQPQYPW